MGAFCLCRCLQYNEEPDDHNLSGRHRCRRCVPARAALETDQ